MLLSCCLREYSKSTVPGGKSTGVCRATPLVLPSSMRYASPPSVYQPEHEDWHRSFCVLGRHEFPFDRHDVSGGLRDFIHGSGRFRISGQIVALICACHLKPGAFHNSAWGPGAITPPSAAPLRSGGNRGYKAYGSKRIALSVLCDCRKDDGLGGRDLHARATPWSTTPAGTSSASSGVRLPRWPRDAPSRTFYTSWRMITRRTPSQPTAAGSTRRPTSTASRRAASG